MDYATLRQALLACRLCEEAFGFTPHPICWGNPDARITQVGQAPSRTVHITRKPFDDASGQKLRGEWYGIDADTFYNPDMFYLTSVGHCYPGKAKGGGDKLPPAHCAKRWLAKEIEAVQSQLILLLGGRAAGFFFPKERFSQLVFTDLTILGKPAFALPHPSPLNIKWFRDHPQFEAERLPIIRNAIHCALK